MVALDDELEVTPADAPHSLVERDIDWGAAGSRPSQDPLLPPNSAPSSKGILSGLIVQLTIFVLTCAPLA